MTWVNGKPVSYNNFVQPGNVIPFDGVKVKSKSTPGPNSMPLDILNQMYKIPKASIFIKSTEMYNSTEHDCAVISTNALLNNEWLHVNCSKKIENALIVCEKKKDDIPESSHSVNISSLIEQCRPYEFLVDELCMHLSDRLLYKLAPYSFHLMLDFMYNKSQYLTAWTRQHASDVKPGKSTIDVHLFHDPAVCLRTKYLFFSELKEWRPLICSQGNYLHLRSPTIIIPDCNELQQRCMDGTCIIEHYWCDGQFDCADHSDEELCHDLKSYQSEVQTNTLTYQCREDDNFIPLSRLCNGIADCSDGSDENNLCAASLYIQTNYQLHSHPCPTGWSLCNTNGSSCYPNNHICIHTKTLLGRSLYCEYTEHLKYCITHRCPNNFKV